MKDVNSYLIFDGNCREAMNFYNQCFGGKLDVMSFGDMPADAAGGEQMPPEMKNRVMHARIGNGAKTVLMGSDTMPGHGGNHPADNYSISVDCESDEEVTRLFNALSQNAKKIKMPLGDAFWGAKFGMLEDKFGVHWMFNFDKGGHGA